MSLFKKAVKTEAKLRLSISGPSGGGKTYTGLAIASALSPDEPIAMVDTEHGSASKYADLFAFDVAEMHPPFHPDKFIAAIDEAAKAGYGVIILDSLTHAWSGTGGLLDVVDEIAKRKSSGNTFAAWKDATPIQNRLVDAIIGADIHVIVTMRSKQDYAQEKDDRGKTIIRKVGMAPQQRNGFEYEFDVVFDMDIDNNAIVTKTRCPALAGRVFAKPGKEVAAILREWLQGAPVEQLPASLDDAPELNPEPGNPFNDPPPPSNGHSKQPITRTNLNILHALGVAYYSNDWDAKRVQLVEYITKGAESSSNNLTANEGAELIAGLEKKVREEYAKLAATAHDTEPLADVANLSGVKLAQTMTELRARVVAQADAQHVDEQMAAVAA